MKSLLLVIFAFCLPAVEGCRQKQPPPQPVTITGETMGTDYKVKIAGLSKSHQLADVKAEIDKRLKTVNDQMSTWQTNSELSRFNRCTATNWFAVSRETATVVSEAIRIGELSGGAFDVTVGPLVNLWSFGPENRPKKIPADEEIAFVKRRIGLGKLSARLDPPALKKSHGDVSVDLSAIAKGFGVDKIAEYLDELKPTGYMVIIGGEVRCRGTTDDGTGWKIGIQSPNELHNAAYRTVTLHNTAMATSGDYRNYFEQNGKRYSHTIDPRTGRPVRHPPGSVSVLDARCAVADAYATALVVLGPEAGYALAVELDLPALFLTVDEHGTIQERMTPAFEAIVTGPHANVGSKAL